MSVPSVLRDWAPLALGMIITLGFFGILVWMLRHGVPESGRDALLVMLGSLGTSWAAVVNYYYGSSSGSARKTLAMERMGTGTAGSTE